MNNATELPGDPADPNFAAPAWLVSLLQPAVGSEPLRRTCAQAAEDGLALARLRDAGQRLGFSFLSIPAYLRGLSGVAGVPLEAPLRWAGLSLDAVPGPALARSWGRLARALDLCLREAQWYLRLTFAEDREIVFSLAARPTGGSGFATAYEATLNDIVARWDDHRRANLRECENLLVDEYRRADLDALPV